MIPITDLAAAALVFVLSLQPNLTIGVLPDSIVVPANGTVFVANGVTGCAAGHIERLDTIARADVVEHELLHAADCMDDGRMNGSPLPPDAPCKIYDCAHAWVYWAKEHPERAADILAHMTRDYDPARIRVTVREK